MPLFMIEREGHTTSENQCPENRILLHQGYEIHETKYQPYFPPYGKILLVQKIKTTKNFRNYADIWFSSCSYFWCHSYLCPLWSLTFKMILFAAPMNLPFCFCFQAIPSCVGLILGSALRHHSLLTPWMAWNAWYQTCLCHVQGQQAPYIVFWFLNSHF